MPQMLRSVAAALALSPLCLAQDQPFVHLPKDATSVTVCGDVLPAVRALLAAPEVEAVFAAAGDDLLAEFGVATSPAQLRAQLGLFEDLIPRAVALGMPTRTTDAMFRIMQSMVCATLLMPMEIADVDAGLRAMVREQLEAGLAGVARLDAVVAATMRSERAAEQALERLRELLRGLEGSPGCELELDGDELHVAFELLEVAGGRFAGMLRRLRVDVPAAAVTRCTMSLSQHGEDLVLRIGAPAAGPLDPSDFGRLWTPDAPPMVFSQVRCDVVDDYYALQEALAEVAGVDEEMVAMAAASLLESLQTSGSQFEPCSSRVVVDGGFVLEIDEPVDAEVAQWLLPPDALARCAAGAAGPVSLDPAMFDGMLLDVLYGAELGATMLFDESVYERLPALAEYLEGPDSALFQPGVVALAQAAAYRGAKRAGLAVMPWAKGAVVAAADDAESAQAFMAELGDRLVEDLGLERAPWTATDLELGVPSHAVDVAALLPAFAAIGADCDFEPHWFAVDAFLVWSTDRAMSREVIARLRAADADADLVGASLFARVSGEALNGFVEALRAWAGALSQGPNAVEAYDALFVACGRLLARVDAIELRDDIVDGVMRSRFEVRLR